MWLQCWNSGSRVLHSAFQYRNHMIDCSVECAIRTRITQNDCRGVGPPVHATNIMLTSCLTPKVTGSIRMHSYCTVSAPVPRGGQSLPSPALQWLFTTNYGLWSDPITASCLCPGGDRLAVPSWSGIECYWGPNTTACARWLQGMLGEQLRQVTGRGFGSVRRLKMALYQLLLGICNAQTHASHLRHVAVYECERYNYK